MYVELEILPNPNLNIQSLVKNLPCLFYLPIISSLEIALKGLAIFPPKGVGERGGGGVERNLIHCCTIILRAWFDQIVPFSLPSLPQPSSSPLLGEVGRHKETGAPHFDKLTKIKSENKMAWRVPAPFQHEELLSPYAYPPSLVFFSIYYYTPKHFLCVIPNM